MTKKKAARSAADLEQLLPIRRCGSCGDRQSLIDFPRDRSKARGRAYRCKSCHAERQRRWCRENPDAVRASGARWRTANPHRRWEGHYRERARRAGFEPVVEPFTAADIIARDGEGCSGCGAEVDDLQLHHFVPLSLGGNHTLRNVRFLCPQCNRDLIRGEVAEVRRRKAEGIYPFGIIPSERFEEEFDLTSPLARKQAA